MSLLIESILNFIGYAFITLLLGKEKANKIMGREDATFHLPYLGILAILVLWLTFFLIYWLFLKFMVSHYLFGHQYL